jgi:RNA polymerase sigma-70 factor, ECF subfamily
MAKATPGPALNPDDPPEVALERLMEDHGGRLFALGQRFCGSREEAEDLVQEVLLAAYRGWDGFQGQSEVSTWLYTIAARVCGRMHRKRSGEPQQLESLDQALPFGATAMAVLPSADPGPLERAQLEEARTRLEAAIGELPDTFRLPLVLKEVVGFSLAQIARILSTKPATVKTRLHRARLALREALEEGLPSRPAAEPAYSRQVCLDLLAAKQEALDRGADFEWPPGVICERCANVFAALDLTGDLCRSMAQGELPGHVRRRVLEAAAQG